MSKEWPRVGNGPGLEIRTVVIPCLRRIVHISYHWCLTFWGQMFFRNLTDVSGRMAQMIQFYIITLFLYRLISDDCYEDCMSLDSRCILLWLMCSAVCDYMPLIKYLCATWCGNVPVDCSCVLLWINKVVLYWMILFRLPWRLSTVLKMIIS